MKKINTSTIKLVGIIENEEHRNCYFRCRHHNQETYFHVMPLSDCEKDVEMPCPRCQAENRHIEYTERAYDKESIRKATAILDAGFVHIEDVGVDKERVENILNDVYVRIPLKGTRLTRLQADAIAKAKPIKVRRNDAKT